MKKLIIIFCLLSGANAFCQIETSLRWVGIGPTGGLNFFLDDSTDLVTIDCDYHSGYALFTDPKDSLLYGLFRGTGEDYGNQNLYIVNPFNGDIDLVQDFSGTGFTSADINTDGSVIYLIEGEGETLGNIVAFDTDTETETHLTTAFGVPGESTYGIDYHPLDDQLYVYEGSEVGETRLQQIDVNTLTNSMSSIIGHDGFIDGALWSETDYKFLVFTSYDCDFFISKVFPNELEAYYTSCMPETSDIARIHTIYAEGDSVAICPATGDSTHISLMYDVNSFAWYKDGVLLPDETASTITISEPGTYKAAMEIGTTTAMLFSREVTVYPDPGCTASLGEFTAPVITLYPNPVKETLQISTNAILNDIIIRDIKGNALLHPDNGSNLKTIDVSTLPPGVYIVEIQTKTDTYYKKIIK